MLDSIVYVFGFSANVQLFASYVILYTIASHVAVYSLFPTLHSVITTVCVGSVKSVHVHPAKSYPAFVGLINVISPELTS